MSTLKVNTIQSNTTSELDINSPLGTVPSLDVINSVTVGGNINAVGVITATTLNGNLNSTGVTTVTRLNVGTGASISSPATNVLALGTNDLERIRIASTGAVGVGTNNPTTEFEVLGSGTVASFRGTGGSSFIGIKDEDDGTVAFIGVDGGTLKVQTSGSSYSDKLNIDTSGNIGINSTSPARKLDVVDSGASGSVIRSRVTTNNGGYLAYEALNSSGTSVFSVTHNGRINLSENIVFASGQGLDFSATANSSGTMTSELLSDYEEGTWTPTVIFGGNSTGITYNAQTGGYIKIGSQVTVWFYLSLSNKGSSTGDSKIASLPFTNSSVPGRSEGATFTPNYWGGFNSAIIPGGYVQVNTTLIYMVNTNAATSTGAIANSVWSNTTSLYGCVTYSIV
jgi:hypothetical protein